MDIVAKKLECLHKYRSGMNNPLGITLLQDIPGFSNGYVYGDYWGNPNKEANNIYRLEESGPVCVYSFPSGRVLHIHGITADKKSGRVLICTGDQDAESAIWEAFDDFKRVEPLVSGSQTCRSCAAYITDNGILYATDTPLENNGIYLYSEEKKQAEKIYDMPGPCIYATTLCDAEGKTQYVFATSVEPDSSLPAWRYRFTYRLGAGVKSRWVNIIAGNPENGFRTVARFKKDTLPMLLFQFGNVLFAHVEENDRVYLTPVGVKKQEQKTLQLDI